MRAQIVLPKLCLILLCLASLARSMSIASADTAQSAGIPQQVIASVNQDRIDAGLAALTFDPRLAAVAEARAQYIVANSRFSHCTAGDDDASCSRSGLDFVPRDQRVGVNFSAVGTVAAENLALNNFSAATAAAQTNTMWLNSDDHRSNIMNAALQFTGVGIACCFSGDFGGQQASASDGIAVYVQEFSGGPGALPGAASADSCRFVLGFATLAALLPAQVGQCAGDQHVSSALGDAVQATTGGLLVWRKSDNWTAFTDGFHSWVMGPRGLQERLNSQRFAWEANPGRLPLAPT